MSNNQNEHTQPLAARIKRQLNAINAIQTRMAKCPTCGKAIQWRKSEMLLTFAMPCGHKLGESHA